MEKQLYKVLNGDKSCNGGDYVYDLPKRKKDGTWKPGKWTKRIKKSALNMCKSGYHLTTNPVRWLNNTSTAVYRAEAKGVGLYGGDKCVCAQVRLLEPYETNTGAGNMGLYNSGNWNSGNWNSGNWNSGNYHTGYFNTDKEPPFLMFDKPCKKSRNKIKFPYYFKNIALTEWIDYTDEEKKSDDKKALIGGYLKIYTYKEAWLNAFKRASKEDIELTTKLPNFDYKIFEEITGITKNDIESAYNER